MNDQEFLIWLHERLEHQHGENRYVDYMHKLRAIILATDPIVTTPNVGTTNGIEGVRKILSDNH
jgi:hypothetical protein